MTDEQLGQIYHTARNANTFRDFKRVAIDVLSASIADTAGAKAVALWAAFAPEGNLLAHSKLRPGLSDILNWEPLYRASAPASSVALCSICNGYGRWQDGHSGRESDGYAPNIVECECTDEERRPECRKAAPSVADAAGAINLEGLRKKLLTPRKILRDADGFLTHPDLPICDEGTRADKLLEAFGIETKFRSMESDDPEGAERYFEVGEPDCSYWTPTPPEGDGWLLLEIYDTEDGPYAMFGRDAYEVELARKREHTRKLADAARARRDAAIAKESGK